MAENFDPVASLNEKLGDAFWEHARSLVMKPEHLRAVYTEPSSISDLTDSLLAPLLQVMEETLEELESNEHVHALASGTAQQLDTEVVREFMRDYSVNYPDQWERGATMVNVELSGEGISWYITKWLNDPGFLDREYGAVEYPDSMLVLIPGSAVPDGDPRKATITDMARQRTCYSGCGRTCSWTTVPPEDRFNQHRSFAEEVEAELERLREAVSDAKKARVKSLSKKLDYMLSLDPGTVGRALEDGWAV